MSIKKESTVKNFEGWVTFCQPMTLEQVIEFEKAEDDAADFTPEPSALLSRYNEIKGIKDAEGNPVKAGWVSAFDRIYLPLVVRCVEKFEVLNFPEKVTTDNFPMTPRVHSSEFIGFLVSQIRSIYNGEIEVPNES